MKLTTLTRLCLSLPLLGACAAPAADVSTGKDASTPDTRPGAVDTGPTTGNGGSAGGSGAGGARLGAGGSTNIDGGAADRISGTGGNSGAGGAPAGTGGVMGGAGSTGFVHPGLLLTTTDIARMKAKIAARSEP